MSEGMTFTKDGKIRIIGVPPCDRAGIPRYRVEVAYPLNHYRPMAMDGADTLVGVSLRKIFERHWSHTEFPIYEEIEQ